MKLLTSEDFSVRNHWLDALPSASLGKILDHAHTVHLRQRQVLHDVGAVSEFIYFPSTVVCSMVVSMGDGKMVETVMVGFEGYAPTTAGIMPLSRVSRTVVEVPGNALALENTVWRRLIKEDHDIAHLRAQYVTVMFDVLMQSAACNAVHSIRQRCARWLLSLSDRTKSNDLAVIHQALAEALGASRPRVTEILAVLQADGLVELQRATLRITDTTGLMAASCECYAAVKAELSGFANRIT